MILRGKIQGSIIIINRFEHTLCLGVECFSLSSSPISSEEGHVIACPHTTVTLTCTATHVATMTWFEHNREIRVFLVSDYEEGQSRVFQDDPYTVSITVNNITMEGIAGDITSTVEVMVDDINNGTPIRTRSVPQE